MFNHAERNLLHAYLDDELDLVRSMELEDHLGQCGDCAREASSYRALRESLSNTGLRYAAPAEFRTKLMAELEQVERPVQEPVAVRMRVPFWSWAPVAACLPIAFTATFMVFNARGDRALVQEAVADHVRSLMATHLTDVLTSDQHTVKPWFNGKLDFSPKVRDFSSDGFELTGGRLDYLDAHTAAAIVYQRRKHIINVFTWPAAGSDEAPRMSALQGYNTIVWRQAGMEYCAVSDLNQQELSELVSLMRK